MPDTQSAPVQGLAAACHEPPLAVDPLAYPAWDSLLTEVPEHSFFHESGWARVLHQTYGHHPFYLCQFFGERLEALLPLMEVSSAVTGLRGVSLPFTDFCPPLFTGASGAAALFERALERGRARGWRYLECRGGLDKWPGAKSSLAFYGHIIELGGGLDSIFARFAPAVRRGIRKAEREGVRIEFNGGEESMRGFYALHCQTRRRHGLPPQPFRFFRNIAVCLLGQGHGFIATALERERPVASAMFFGGGTQALYKFGASNEAFQHLRPNNLLMWEAVKRCAAVGFESLHLGRTSLGNGGLRRFKLGFGAREERIDYCRYDFRKESFVTSVDRAEGWANRVFRLLPHQLLRLAGRMLYPHLS